MSNFMSYSLAGPDPNPMSVPEVDALKELVRAVPFPLPRTIIQVGAERGCSTLAILEACPDSFIFSIDVGERPEERANLERAGLPASRVVRGLGRSQAIGLHWPFAWEADLLLIDGDHRYDGVWHDIQVWSPVVKFGGTLVLHDYIPPDQRAPTIVGRVWEAVEDHKKTGLLTDWIEVLRVDRLVAFRHGIAWPAVPVPEEPTNAT
jgi:predicted O-methyltransferase YrrM